MSLSLLQGYSSAEDEEPAEPDRIRYGDSSEEDAGEEGDGIGGNTHSAAPKRYDSSVFDFPDPTRKSALPSAFDAFSKISGPPEFLNHAVEEPGSVSDSAQQQGRHRGRREFKDKKDMPSVPARNNVDGFIYWFKPCPSLPVKALWPLAGHLSSIYSMVTLMLFDIRGAVVEAKPQLVGIHDRVRSDIEGSKPPVSAVPNTKQDGTKRVATATNPNAEDAAELLRMCLQCGVPKTYSSARGMVCRCVVTVLLQMPTKIPRRRGLLSKIRESKRMKGQSSHASWKSETEMQLRQQFD
ncbi:Endoplasmic reticulum vesicle transporter protein [Hibiscus syriacus]|uniref:Endoplasmic reticulum vesicle transporter protein n=1 Tax=Hibiscus syriacus TaxID=106335 RepID=A0A6A2ZLT2_HIBSY|nr:Endoplasmic reticulum vesicle transporter protein [Hibiscus syriacus]